MSDHSKTALKHPEFYGRIGVARQEITPPVGIYARLWGSAVHDVAEGVHRPALATCVTFRDSEDSELILIALDACIFLQEEMLSIRSRLLQQFRLQPQQLTIHPSHSHSMPSYSRKHVDRPGGHLIVPYLDALPGVCATLIERARAAATEATLTWAYGKCGLAFNRDFVDPANGREVCGLNTATPADDTLLVGRIVDTGGIVRATLVNYACHPVSLGGRNRLISPDYAGAMREVVEKETNGAVCVFLHGPSGDLTPRRSYEADVEAADQNGRELGFAALAVIASMFPPRQQLEYVGIEESGTPLGVWRLRPKAEVNTRLSAKRVTTRLPLKAMPERAEIDRQLEVATERYEIERLERTRGRIDLGGTGDFYLNVWQLGDAHVVCVPSESYSALQLQLRSAFPDAAVAVLNLCDGTFMYLPTAVAYERNDVYPVRVALYESGSLEQVASLAAEAIQNMAAASAG
jgi:hypothetical protein